MSTPAISCPCGNQFDLPENFESRRVNCPVCNAAIFLTADQLPGAEPQAESQGGYGFALEAEPAEAKQRQRGVEGIPDWLGRYRKNRDIKKADREKTMSLLENLGAASSTSDPLGATLFLAATHADAETSVAALATVAISGHATYAPVAHVFLEYVGPSDAGGAQQMLNLLNEAGEPNAALVSIRILRKFGPTPLVQIRSLIALLGSKHAELHLWAVQCLGLIGPPAKNAVATLLQLFKRDDDALRIAAIDALGAIARDAERILPLLLTAFKNQSPNYRSHAATAIGQYGAAAAKAVPALQGLLNDNDPGVRLAASMALQTVVAAVQAMGGAVGAPVAQPAAAPTAEKPPEQIVVICSCGKKLKADPEMAGKKGKCPRCGKILMLPVPNPQPAEPRLPESQHPEPQNPKLQPPQQASGSAIAASSGGEAPAGAAAPSAEQECPVCLAMVPAKSVLCVYCGHDFR